MVARAEQPVKQTPPPPIQRWIAQLDDDQYATREQAQLHLEHTGLAALDAVADAAHNGSLERATRAINILLSWSESRDSALQIAALEKLAALPNRSEAEMASQMLANVREQAALEAITALGGHYMLDPQARGVFQQQQRRQQPPLQIIIGLQWKGGVEGLKHLSAIRRATTVSLHSARLGDEALEPLAKLPHVRRIELYGTDISSAAIKKLREQIPSVKIAVRSAARLGIQGYHQNGGALVNAIMQGSAAEKAGLQPRDLITEMDGEKLQDFTDLTDRIAQHQPGDTVVLKIVRNGNVQELKVTFDRWGSEEANPEDRAGTPHRAPQGKAPKIILDRR